MQMMRAQCKECQAMYDVVAIPMPADLACRVMTLRDVCPYCGNPTGNLVAPARDLTAEEVELKRRAVAK